MTEALRKTYKVGVKPVRELLGVMAAEKADRTVFITSGVYTDEALRFAEGKPIELKGCKKRGVLEDHRVARPTSNLSLRGLADHHRVG